MKFKEGDPVRLKADPAQTFAVLWHSGRVVRLSAIPTGAEVQFYEKDLELVPSAPGEAPWRVGDLVTERGAFVTYDAEVLVDAEHKLVWRTASRDGRPNSNVTRVELLHLDGSYVTTVAISSGGLDPRAIMLAMSYLENSGAIKNGLTLDGEPPRPPSNIENEEQ